MDRSTSQVDGARLPIELGEFLARHRPPPHVPVARLLFTDVSEAIACIFAIVRIVIGEIIVWHGEQSHDNIAIRCVC